MTQFKAPVFLSRVSLENKNETSVNFRRVTRFQQTNNVGMIASLTEHNKQKIPRIFSSLIFPYLISFSPTNTILYEVRNVLEWLKFSSSC